MVASLGYLIDSFGGFLSASYNANLALFTFVGEMLLMGWLLWKRLSSGSCFPAPSTASFRRWPSRLVTVLIGAALP